MTDRTDLVDRRPDGRVHQGRLHRAAARRVQLHGPGRARWHCCSVRRVAARRRCCRAWRRSSNRRRARSRTAPPRSPRSPARRSPTTAGTASASCSRRSTSCPASTASRTSSVPMRSAGVSARAAHGTAIALLEERRARRPTDPSPEQPQRRPAAARRDRQGARRSTRR